MTKKSYFQVKLIESSTFVCCANFVYFNFGNLTNAIKCIGFLHITNLIINKNKYYEFNF